MAVKRVGKLAKVTKSSKTSRSSGKVSVSLPSEPSVPCTELRDFSMLIFGEKKIGKTTLTSQFPESIHLMTEPGGKKLRIYQRYLKTWSEFRAYVDALEKDKKFKTVHIDIVDNLYNMCIDWVCEKNVIDHPSDESYGKGWNKVRKEFTKQITRLLSMDKGVVFISHSKEEEIEKRNGGKYHMLVPTASGQARDILTGIVDIWAYYTYDNEERYLTIAGNDHIGAGHRLPISGEDRCFTYKGQQLKKIYMGRSEAEAYKNFTDAFKNEYVPKSDEEVFSDESEKENESKKKVKKAIKKKK